MSLLHRVEKQLASAATGNGLNSFITHALPNSLAQAGPGVGSHDRSVKSELAGKTIAVKDNICTGQLPTSCGSAILRDYRSPFTATVVDRLTKAGAIVSGKTNLDEFGMGSHSIFSAFGPVLNSQDPSLSAGGSSGGSAVAVANGDCFGALGTDTGGSVRLPAAYNGIVGFKPSYGTISRYGVIAYANSMDTVGILAGNCTDAASIFDAVDAYDSNDPTSLLPTIRRRMRESEKSLMERKTFSIGVPSQLNLHELTSDIRAAWLRALLNLQQLGHTIHEVSIPAAKLALPAYYILAPAEASSNLAKYDGVRFGNEMADPLEPAHVLYASTRGLGLGEEVRRRILLGAYSLSATAIDNYFIQAQRVRNMVLQDFDQVFNLVNPLHSMQVQPRDNAVDFLLSPTATTPPPKVENLDERAPTEAYSDDVLTVPASLAGLPAVNIPYFQISNPTGAGRGGNALIGLQLIGQFGTDRSLLKAGRHLEQAFRSDDERPPT